MASRRAEPLIVSPCDPGARYPGKRGKGWEGCKVHLSGTCHEPEPDAAGQAPNLITNVAAAEATVPGAAMTEPVHDMLDAAGLLPGEHAVAAGDTSADLLLAARTRGITLAGPLLAGTSPQARAGGYTAEAFTIDREHQRVTCPQGATSIVRSPCRQRGTEAIVVRFAAGTCPGLPGPGPVHPLIPLRPPAVIAPARVHEAVAEARAAQTTGQCTARYNIRAGVEGTMRQATHVTGIAAPATSAWTRPA